MDNVRVCPAQAMNMAKASANTTAVVSVLLNIMIVFRLVILGCDMFAISPVGGYDCQRNSLKSETQVMSNEHEHSHPHTHQSHEAIIKRLKRADGHLRSIILMIEEGRECVDIAQQLHAVEKAVCQAKRTLIQDHIDHCLEDAVSALNKGERAPLEAFKQITKYL